MSGSLTEGQCRSFERDGFLYPVEALTADKALEFRTRLEETECDYAARCMPVEPPLSHFLMGGASHAVLPLAAELAAQEKILDAVESLLGRDLMVWGVSFFIKNSRDGTFTTWHQDLAYWGFGETANQVTAWLALTPATEENGCMRFVAGSHKRRLVPHRESPADLNLLSRGQEIEVQVSEEEASCVVLRPGQFSLHHGLMFHGSGPNHSSDRRIGVAIRYVNPNASQTDGSREYAMLVRGADRRQNFIHFAPPCRFLDPPDVALHREILEAKTAGQGLQ